MGFMRVYTGEVIAEKYPASLANSVHFAYSGDGTTFQPLNQGYGILFARAEVREDDTLAERGVREPRLYREGDEYVITAVILNAAEARATKKEGGETEGAGTEGERAGGCERVRWRTKDFVTFSEQEPVSGGELRREPEARQGHSAGESASAAGTPGKPEHSGKPGQPGQGASEDVEDWGAEVLEIPDALWEDIRNRWQPLECVGVEYPPEVEVGEWAELDKLTVRVIYSDGSKDEKKVAWNREGRIKLHNNCYRISGTIAPRGTGFPLAVGYADPVIFSWQGSWFFLATNDNVNDVGLFMRKADTVEGLFAGGAVEVVGAGEVEGIAGATEVEGIAGATEVEDDAGAVGAGKAGRVTEACILDYSEEKGFCQTFWAPEAHVIGGRLYILFAVSGRQWGPQCHVMRLREGGDPMSASDWEEPVRVCRADGKPLAREGITLDMTYFRAGDKSYVCWSYRYGIGTPRDTGSMLYLAAVEESCPWVLASEPVLLSRPLYGWENNSGTINNEGPHALILGDRIYLSYSGGDACGYSYAVGYLTASVRDDLLDPGNWAKQPAPVLCSASVEGIQGPGHNSFFRDEEGKLMIAYHAQEREKHFKRCTAFHRVHLSKGGFPLLNVAGERDVAEAFRRVELTVRM